MKKLIIVLISSILILSILITGIIYYNSNKASPSYSNINCEALINNGISEDKVNIVFITNEVNKLELMKYTDLFFKTPPFSENKEKFNFYYLNTQPKCEITSSALLCYSKNLMKIASSCPNDFIVVLSKKEPNIRSSSYINVISINFNSQASVFLHEFAHAFANLADEYVPAKIPFGAKNCDKNQAYEENYQGCSEADYYRSSPASLMRTLSANSYDALNEKLITEKIL